MSLDFNFSKCKDLELVRSESLLTDMVIWATMAVGIRELTKANAQEFYDRVHLQEKKYGTYLNQDGKPRPITLEDVKNRIGLYTNAGTFGRREFEKRLAKK